MDENKIMIGADIGGSHITAAQVDPIHKTIIDSSYTREVVDSFGSAETIIDTWSRCLLKATGNRSVDKICLALPGPFDYEEGICFIKDQNKYPYLYGLNIKELLAEKLQCAKSNLYFNNDAACYLQGEVFAGKVQDYEKVLGITLGTGLGSAVYANGFAESADAWNLPFRESIAEEYLSTRWFIKRFAALTGKTIQGVKELSGYADEIDRVKSIYAEFGYNLACFLAQFLKKENATAVVIGGNIIHAWPWFKHALEENIHKEFPQLVIEPSVLGEKATLFGAVSAWLHSAKMKSHT